MDATAIVELLILIAHFNLILYSAAVSMNNAMTRASVFQVPYRQMCRLNGNVLLSSLTTLTVVTAIVELKILTVKFNPI